MQHVLFKFTAIIHKQRYLSMPRKCGFKMLLPRSEPAHSLLRKFRTAALTNDCVVVMDKLGVY